MPLLSFLFCSSWFSDAAAAANSAIISRDDRPRSFLRDLSSRRSRPDARDVRQCSRTRFHRDFWTDIGRKGGKRASHSVDQRETLKTVSRFSRLFARQGPFDVSHRTGPSDWSRLFDDNIRLAQGSNEYHTRFVPPILLPLNASIRRSSARYRRWEQRWRTGIIGKQLPMRCRARRNRNRKYRGADRRMRNSSRLSSDRRHTSRVVTFKRFILCSWDL